MGIIPTQIGLLWELNERLYVKSVEHGAWHLVSASEMVVIIITHLRNTEISTQVKLVLTF